MTSSRISKLLDRIGPEDKVLCIGFMAHNVESSGYSLQSKMDKGDCVIEVVDEVTEDYLGIDIEEEGYEEVKEKYGFNVRKLDFLESDFEDEFEVILAFDLLDHISNLDRFYDSFRRALKENGSLIVCDDRVLSQRNFFKILLGGEVNHDSDNFIKLDEKIVENHAYRFGFEVVESSHLKPKGFFSSLNYRVRPELGSTKFWVEMEVKS